MKVDVLEGLAEVGEDPWRSLLTEAAFPSPFMSWTWQAAWFDAFGGGRRLRLLCVRDGRGDLAGLLPLYEERPGVLRILGGVDVSDYLDVIAPAGAEEEVWAALLEHHAGATWDLHAIRAVSPTVTLLPALAPSYGRSAAVTVEECCPVLALPPSWEAYLAALPGKQRHEIERKRRRLRRELPDARVASYTSPEDIEPRLGTFFELHRRSRTGKARFMDARMERFFRAAISGLAARGMARLWLLEAGSPAIAAFVSLEWPGAVGLYNSGFDVGMAALSPGIVLLANVIRDAIGRGVPRFDFLRGEEPYKLGFGAEPEHLYRIEVTP